MSQIQLKSLLGKMRLLLEEGHHLFGYVCVNSAKMENMIDRIAEAVPKTVSEAEEILKRKDEIIIEAQNRAERIIREGIEEQRRLAGESEVLRKVKEEAVKQQQQVTEYCENLKLKTYEELAALKEETLKQTHIMQEGAEDYADKIFNSLDGELENFLAGVKRCKIMLTDKKNQNKVTRQNRIAELYADETGNDEKLVKTGVNSNDFENN